MNSGWLLSKPYDECGQQELQFSLDCTILAAFVCSRAYLPIWEQKEFHSHPISFSLTFCIPGKLKGISPKAGNSCRLESILIVQGAVTMSVQNFWEKYKLFILGLGWKTNGNDKSSFH